jgi:rubrerythrin
MHAQLSERLKACLKVELLCEEIYYKLCELFPDSRELFQPIANTEKRHADILTICLGFNNLGDLPDIIVPGSLPLIKKSLDLTEHIKAQINNGITLKKALKMALDLENTTAENYFNEVMTKEADSEIIAYLQQFYKDEKSHSAMIKEYIKNN